MSLRGYGNKRDIAEKDIVDFLRARGCSVYRLDKPVDLLIGYRDRNILAEVKTNDGKLTPSQIEFRDGWKGDPFWILRTIEDAEDMLEAFDRYGDSND